MLFPCTLIPGHPSENSRVSKGQTQLPLLPEGSVNLKCVSLMCHVGVDKAAELSSMRPSLASLNHSCERHAPAEGPHPPAPGGPGCPTSLSLTPRDVLLWVCTCDEHPHASGFGIPSANTTSSRAFTPVTVHRAWDRNFLPSSRVQSPQ